jgi:hypothetical protein
LFHHVHTSKIHVLWMLEKMLGFVFFICLSFKDGSLFKITLPTKSFELVWHVALAQVWTHYKIRKLNMWTLFCNVCIKILNSQIWKEIMLELSGKPSSLTTTFSTEFSFQNLVFWGIYLNFQRHKSISPTFWIQILSNKFH